MVVLRLLLLLLLTELFALLDDEDDDEESDEPPVVDCELFVDWFRELSDEDEEDEEDTTFGFIMFNGVVAGLLNILKFVAKLYGPFGPKPNAPTLLLLVLLLPDPLPGFKEFIDEEQADEVVDEFDEVEYGDVLCMYWLTKYCCCCCCCCCCWPSCDDE